MPHLQDRRSEHYPLPFLTHLVGLEGEEEKADRRSDFPISPLWYNATQRLACERGIVEEA